MGKKRSRATQTSKGERRSVANGLGDDRSEMKKMIEEMVIEVEKHDQSISVNEELYNKLEMKVRKKFNEEVDKLEKSFRRIMDQLEIQHQNLF